MLLAIAVIVCLIIAYLYYLRVEKQKRIKLLAEEAKARTKHGAEVTMRELENIGNFLLDSSLSDAEVMAKTEAAFAVIEANNPKEMVAGVINDVREYTIKELKARNSAAAK